MRVKPLPLYQNKKNINGNSADQNPQTTTKKRSSIQRTICKSRIALDPQPANTSQTEIPLSSVLFAFKSLLLDGPQFHPYCACACALASPSCVGVCGSYLRGRPRDRWRRLTNSWSSTIQNEPKSSSQRTKHLCSDKFVRIAFWIARSGPQWLNERVLDLFLQHTNGAQLSANSYREVRETHFQVED